MIGLITQRFPLFIVGYFILQILIRLATTNIAVLDESEQIMLTQYFSLGYNEQPPLYTWMQMGVFKLTGTSIFGLSLLKNALLCVTYLMTYQLGMLFMDNKLKASLSALSLFLFPQMVWDAQIDQTHTVFLTAMTSMTVYLFFYIAKKEKITWLSFVFFGISAGVGLLAKYNFILVLVALGSVALFIPAYRKRFYTKALFLSIIIAFCIALPHFLWFISHLDIATNRTVERMNAGHTGSHIINFLKGSSDLIISTLIASLAPFFLFFFLFFKKEFTWNSSLDGKALIGYVVVIFTCLFVMIAMSGTTHIKERWLQPYLVLVPLFFFLHVKNIDTKLMHRFVAVSLIAPIIVALIVLIRPWLIDVRGKPTRASYPFEEVSLLLQQQLSPMKNILFYAEDKYLGGNLKLFFPHSKVITPSLPNQPYQLGEKVVIFWESEKPVTFINSLFMKGYSCEEYTQSIAFQKSKKLRFNDTYMICHLMQ